MKKIISIMLVVFTFVSLIACTPKESETDKLQQEIARLQQQLQQLSDSSQQTSQQLEQQLEQQLKEKELLQQKLDNLMGKAIAFTAEAPVYGYKQGLKKYAVFDNNFTGGDDEYNVFAELQKCYTNEIAPAIDGEFYMIDPNDGEIGPYYKYGRYKSNTIMVEGDGASVINPIFIQNMQIIDEALGTFTYASLPFDETSYIIDTSVTLNCYFGPVSLEKFNFKRVLEFGNNAKNAVYKTYFNIYVDETCIGTCYYDAYVYISQSWFEAYFNNRFDAILYYGDTKLTCSF